MPWWDVATQGPALVREIERQWRAEMQWRQPLMTIKMGVPDSYLFRGRDTLASPAWVPVVGRRAVFTDLGRYGMGVSPLVAVPCVVTTWRLV